jgi:two-component system, OmpR family, KDP operon response regulator KdpE
MSKATILVVDDEPQIQRFLRHALEAAGYAVTSAASGRAALHAFQGAPFDLAIVDLGLPDIDGTTLIGQIRQTLALPIIVLSAQDDENKRIDALDMGANDFVAKPFGIGELLARVRACLRANFAAQATASNLKLGPLAIDIDAHRVDRAGETLKLTPKQFELLVLLARNAGRVLTHRQILADIWGPAHVEDVAYLRVFIGQLRQKIETDPTEPRLIETVPGVGYRAEAGS